TVMSKYGTIARTDGHSKWFMQKTLKEHDRSMDHPWMQMIYNQSFSISQYAAWLALNHALFAAMEAKIKAPGDDEVLDMVHEAALLRSSSLEVDLARLLGPEWRSEAEQMVSASPATRRYLEALGEDASSQWLFLSHHFLQYNAVLAGGSYLGEMVSQKLCVPHGAPGVRFYAFEGVGSGKEPARVQKYLRDFDKIEIGEEDRAKMLVAMKRIYADTEAMMTECFELNPVKGKGYKAAKEDGTDVPPPPCAEQLELDLEQLQAFKGEGGVRILMSLAGELLEISEGRELYGPGGGYAMLAGHDVTRCLATMSLEADDLDDLSWKPETPEDEETLANWRNRLKAKYPVAGKLSVTESSAPSSSQGLRKRATASSGAAPAVSAEAADGGTCPISGKVGVCPMASIMGIGGAKTAGGDKKTAGDGKASAFMGGKSMVASVQKNNSSEESLFYRLCPLHWDDKTVKMLIIVAVTSWISGIFVGWNLRKIMV
ncbi:unnamed protein product, partial [Polarella glacialis]